MKQHFVKFFSPGTMVAETTQLPMESWDVKKAVEMSREIKERHGATPYGFRFITRARTEGELDSQEVARSGMYYLGGKVLTIQDIEARNNPKDRTLLANMRGNGWDRVIESNNSWSWCQPLEDDDIVLDYKED